MSVMKIWMLEYNYPANKVTFVTAWESEESANKQACYNIQSYISNFWSFPNCNAQQMQVAKTINDFIKLHQYKNAVLVWNTCQYNKTDKAAVFWHVVCDELYDMHDAKTPLVRNDSEFKSVSSAVAPTNVAPAQYKATVPGASCRKCHNISQYAYADKPDGTYLCRSCSIFKDIFSS